MKVDRSLVSPEQIERLDEKRALLTRGKTGGGMGNASYAGELNRPRAIENLPSDTFCHYMLKEAARYDLINPRTGR